MKSDRDLIYGACECPDCHEEWVRLYYHARCATCEEHWTFDEPHPVNP